MRLILAGLGIGVAAAMAAALLYPAATPSVTAPEMIMRQPTVAINGIAVAVDIADTPELRTQGLSGREALGENEGMLFIFEEPSIRSFWMKDMYFPIDIIWIGGDGTVVGVTENIQPDTFPQTFPSPEPAQYVLEVPAGWAAANNVGVGDVVSLPVVE